MTTEPTSTRAPTDETPRGVAFPLGPIALRLEDPRLFFIKAMSVVVLSYALLPLLAIKGSIPAVTYVGLLVVIHVIVLVIYVYRVRFRELDPSIRSLVARLIALIVVTWLLVIVSRFEDDSSWGTLALQMLGISVFHALLLALIMFHVERRP